VTHKYIGTIDFRGSVDITDPCYDRDVWCRMNDVKIKEGSYDCIAWYCGKCVGAIGIYLDGNIPLRKSMELIGTIGVDARLAGFFHNKPDYDDDAWGDFCTRTYRNGGSAWIVEDGFYSISGYGDGEYDVRANKEDGEIVALEIRFL